MTDDICEYIKSLFADKMERAGMEASMINGFVDEVERDLRRHFGGDKHYIPSPDKKKRNKAIIAEWRKGVPIDQLAKKYSIHTTTVHRILNANRKTTQCGPGLGTDDWINY